jgi:hypothetical protein
MDAERPGSRAILLHGMRVAYDRLRSTVEGLTDDEFFWEPVPDCWTVRRGEDGKWSADYPDFPHPDPPPFTTIGWRLVHIAENKLMYHEYAYGAARLVWPDIDSTHTARDAVRSLDDWHALLLADLEQVDQRELEALVRTNWGEEWPAWRVFWTMIEHDVHHGAEISMLRDLYRIAGGRALAGP